MRQIIVMVGHRGVGPNPAILPHSVAPPMAQISSGTMELGMANQA
jgi:hypothetical protein